ncbi:30S ribosomal protein S16 [Oceanibaculum indicum]|uniref:Small ribosomal subunit protein bS16 n=1 Tax=Oceanibaculum indicum TaxID=526216 RepID=A0A420WBL4_9PROT|nr:30S ribosomal protein S16 [Oceanibaculum indicum]RKQ68373.1 small subunit ribosomal protein S16 [Oceanibaculum indicum]
MALKIRLARGGAKRRPFYRIVVAQSTAPRDGAFIERIGSYNPMVDHGHPDRLKIDADRAKHWISVGAVPTDRVARFLATVGLGETPALPEQTKKNQPRAKAQERLKEQAALAEKAAAEKAEAEAAAAEAAAAPAEEAPAEAPVEAAAEAPAEEAAEAEKPSA